LSEAASQQVAEGEVTGSQKTLAQRGVLDDAGLVTRVAPAR
jgi:hypothetical protein